MNPVSMHEVNKARHQDLERATEARRNALGAVDARRGLVRTLLEKLNRLVSHSIRPPALQPLGAEGEREISK